MARGLRDATGVTILGLGALIVGASACRRDPPGATGAVHVAAGLNTTCSLDGAGVPRCWGPTMHGVRVPSPETRFASLHASGSNACGITTAHRVVCFGTCGDGLCEPPSGRFDEVAIGSGGEACALVYPNKVECWGFHAPWRSPLPPQASGALHGFVVGEGYACALSEVGAIVCWGDRRPALPPPPSGAGFTAIAAARYEACALDGAGAIACWGLDGGLRPPAHGKYVQIASNWERFCAINDAKRARCFGLLEGRRETTSWHGADLREIAVGQNHACGIDGRGRVICWDGAMKFGEGILPRDGKRLPAPSEAEPRDASAIEASRPAAPAAPPVHEAPTLPIEPPPDSPLVVQVDGRAVPIVSALAATSGGEAVSIVLSTRKLDCAATERTWQRLAKDETRVGFTIAPQLVEPDGHGNFARPPSPRLRVASAHWPGGLTTQADGIATLSSGAAAPGAHRRLAVTYATSFGPVGEDADAGVSTLSVRGAIAIRGCGDHPPAGAPRAQDDLDVEVAGARLPIRGAFLRQDDDGKYLLLTSGAASCPGLLDDFPWDYSVIVRDVASDQRQITVEGATLSSHLYMSPRIVFDLLPPSLAAATDTADVRVDDGGDLTRMPLRIHGIVHAKRCPTIR